MRGFKLHWFVIMIKNICCLQAVESVRVTTSFIDELRNIVGGSNVSTADAVRDQHGHDESYHQ